MFKANNCKLGIGLVFYVGCSRLMTAFLFSLVVLFLPTQFGKHFWPSFSFILGSRIDYLSPTLYVSDIVILLFIFALYWKKRIFISFKVAFFLILLGVEIYFSLAPLLGWYGFLKFIELLLFSFAIRKFLAKKRHFVLVFVLFSVGIIYESTIAILQFLRHGSIGGMFYFLGERFFTSSTPGIANVSVEGNLILRPYATFSHPNVLAGFLVIGMIIVFGGLILAKEKWEKSLFIVSLFLGTFTLILTFGRVATIFWLALLIYFCIYLLSQKEFHKEIMSVIISFALICIFLFGALSFPSVLIHISSTSLGEESIAQRAILASASFQMIKKHPVFGVGLLNFMPNLPAFIGIDKPDLLQPVHNIFLLILSEIGFFGFGFVLWFLVKTTLGLFKLYKKTKIKERFLIVTAFFSLASVVTLGLTDHFFLTIQQGQILLAFVLGYCWALIPQKTSK